MPLKLLLCCAKRGISAQVASVEPSSTKSIRQLPITRSADNPSSSAERRFAVSGRTSPSLKQGVTTERDGSLASAFNFDLPESIARSFLTSPKRRRKGGSKRRR